MMELLVAMSEKRRLKIAEFGVWDQLQQLTCQAFPSARQRRKPRLGTCLGCCPRSPSCPDPREQEANRLSACSPPRQKPAAHHSKRGWSDKKAYSEALATHARAARPPLALTGAYRPTGRTAHRRQALPARVRPCRAHKKIRRPPSGRRITLFRDREVVETRGP